MLILTRKRDEQAPPRQRRQKPLLAVTWGAHSPGPRGVDDAEQPDTERSSGIIEYVYAAAC